jgi:ring-1,2-phenylacetyl-CoA epoxidase subunit PaaD
VLAVLDTVMDPEVPVLSVRELGIVRDVDVSDEGAVTVTVTPTYSGCPAIRVIEQDISAALERAGFGNADIRTVYAPAWTTDWIGVDAKAKLKAYGIAPPGQVESGGLVQLLRRRAAAQCPYCDSHDTELRSEFGSTACKSVSWCRSCRQPFEEFKAI